MFTPIQKIIPKTIKTFGIKREVEAAIICEKYRKLAPRLIHSNALVHTSPKFYRGKTLTIAVENGAWAQQVIEHKEELLGALNESLGKKSVENIRTTVFEVVKPN